MKRHGIMESPTGRWTRAEDYLAALSRERSLRRRRAAWNDKPRTQPEAPKLLLSTVPYLSLLALLGVLAIAIMVVALPGNHPQAKTQQHAQNELGVAKRGWLDEARKEFHR